MPKPLKIFLAGLLLLCHVVGHAAVEGELLEDAAAETADNTALKNEAALFEMIRRGMALSLALCEGNDFCAPEINQTELEQLVERLNHRISVLGVRYGETEDAELEEILLSYSNTLDSYNGYIAVLNALSGGSDDDFSDDFDDDFSDADF